jgi:CRISPR-associated protein Csh2
VLDQATNAITSDDESPLLQPKQLAKRAEILFYYDARMCNPNGDPDENRPRIDKETKRNLVTEFRLKRTIRDYIYNIMSKRNEIAGKKIFMRRELVSERGRELKYIEDLASPYIKYYQTVDENNPESDKEIQKDELAKLDKKTVTKKVYPKLDEIKLISDHIDIRLFGILFTVPEIHFKQIGPVQFSIGQSINEIENDIEIRMTRIVPNTRKEASRERIQSTINVGDESEELLKGAESGTFGEKYVVRYSFIEFHGFVNNNVATETNLTEQDVEDMITAMWKGTDSLSTSSKFGQKSRLLIKVNYQDNGYIGDLDRKCEIEVQDQSGPLSDISQMSLNIDRLYDLLEKNSEIIESIEYYCNSELTCKYDKNEQPFSDALQAWHDKTHVPISKLPI